MSTTANDIADIRYRFEELWDSDIPVVTENTPLMAKDVDVWARFLVVPQDEQRNAIGFDQYEQIGRIFIQVFTKIGTGSERANALAISIKEGFREWRGGVSDIRFGVGRGPYPINVEPNYFGIEVSVPYRATH